MSTTRLIFAGLATLLGGAAAAYGGSKLQIETNATTYEGKIDHVRTDKNSNGDFINTNVLYYDKDVPAEHKGIWGNYDLIPMELPNDKKLITKAQECCANNTPVKITYNAFLFPKHHSGASKQVTKIEVVDNSLRY